MSEDYDYNPTAWAGHDYTKARAAYASHVGSSYRDATTRGVKAADCVEDTLSTTAMRPLIVVIDGTGSMGDWPGTMFSKLPFLDHEVRWYLGDDAEVAFLVVGDSLAGDRYPLQSQPFGSGKDLEKALTNLIIEGGGGFNDGESYALAALYLARNLDVSPLAEPIVIFIGDEPINSPTSVSDAKAYCKVDLERSISSGRSFQELRERASVYFIHKPYGYDTFTDDGKLGGGTRAAHNSWSKVIDPDCIARLADPNRVVDVIFGILAREVDRVDDFREEIEGRQNPDQVDVVYESLKTIHAVTGGGRKALGTGKSVLLGHDDGAASKPLGG